MVNNYVNPYINPYQYPNYQQQVQPSLPQQQVTKVNGENGARAYQLAPNSSAWLLDESGLISWLVISDGAGYRTVTPYDIAPHQQKPQPDYSTLESRIARLEEQINANTTDSTAVRRKGFKSTNASVDSANAEC